MNRDKVLGVTEPRVFTSPKRELTPDTTDGFAVIAFAENMLGLKLFPWQHWIFKHALELNDDGTYRFRVVIVELARQSGKTMTEIILALWHMYVLKSPEIIGTAQSLEKAEDAWKEAVSMAQGDPELSELIPSDGIFLGHPKQFVVLHDDARCEYRIAAATRRGGRGFSADLILLDELREHTNWDSWASVTNTMNARPRAQAWAFSNAGDMLSVVLRYQRALAHRDLGWPDGDKDVQEEILLDVVDTTELEDIGDVDDENPFETGYFEWSMPHGVARNNLHGLAQANPSMNHTDVTRNCVTSRALLHGVYNSPATVVETEICCRWPTMGTGGPFVEGSWEATQSTDVRPAADAKSVVCVEVSSKRMQTYIARAGVTDDENVVVAGIWQDRTGTDWVLDWIVEQGDSIDAVIIRTQTGSPSMSLYDDLIDAELTVVEWKGADVGAATGQVFDRLRDNVLCHLPHAGLDLAATSAATALQPQGGFVIDIKKSPTDTAPLLAVIGAVWGTAHVPDTVSLYAKDDVMVIPGRR